MENENKTTSGAPSSDTTSALFVSARKKQIEQQETERLAKEKEEKRLAAEAEVRRLEQEVADRKRKAEEDAKAAEEETKRIAEESKAKIAAAEAAAAAEAKRVTEEAKAKAAAEAKRIEEEAKAKAAAAATPATPAAPSGFTSAPAATSGFTSAPTATSGFSSAPAASTTPTPAVSPAPTSSASETLSRDLPAGAATSKPLDTKLLLIIGGAVLGVILIVVLIVVLAGGSGDSASDDDIYTGDIYYEDADVYVDEETDEYTDNPMIFAELEEGDYIEIGDMDGLDDGEQYFYDNSIGLEFYYPNEWTATAYKASDDTPFDTVTMTPDASEGGFSISIDVSDCTPALRDYIDIGGDNLIAILDAYIAEMAQTYSDDYSNFVELELQPVGTTPSGATTYGASFYTNDTYQYSGLAVLIVDGDTGMASAVYIVYDVNDYTEDMDYARDLILNSVKSYAVG
jgi:hypothetical protein